MKKVIAILIIIWFASFGYTIYHDASRTTQYAEYVVVDKGMAYSYYKNSSTQINTLIVKEISTGVVTSKEVNVVTHYKYKIGDKISFEVSTGNCWMCMFLAVSLALGLCVFLICAICLLIRDLWTGRV